MEQLNLYERHLIIRGLYRSLDCYRTWAANNRGNVEAATAYADAARQHHDLIARIEQQQVTASGGDATLLGSATEAFMPLAQGTRVRLRCVSVDVRDPTLPYTVLQGTEGMVSEWRNWSDFLSICCVINTDDGMQVEVPGHHVEALA